MTATLVVGENMLLRGAWRNLCFLEMYCSTEPVLKPIFFCVYYYRYSKTYYFRQNNNFSLRAVSLANCLTSLQPQWWTPQPAAQSVHLSHLCCNRSLCSSSPQFQVSPRFWYSVRLFNIAHRILFFYTCVVYTPGSNDTQVFPGTSGPSGITVNQGKPPLNLSQSVQVWITSNLFNYLLI